MKNGVGKPSGCYGFTALASDFDNDGYPDLYVACDSRPSLLYHNQKNGTFEEVGSSDAGRPCFTAALWTADWRGERQEGSGRGTC